MRALGPMEKLGCRLDNAGRSTGQSHPAQVLLLALVWIATGAFVTAATWFLFWALTLLALAGLDAAEALKMPSDSTVIVIATVVWAAWAIGCGLYFGRLWLTIRQEDREASDR